MDSTKDIQQPQSITLDLQLDEVSGLLDILGSLPTKSGVYPIALKIKNQAEAQLSNKEND